MNKRRLIEAMAIPTLTEALTAVSQVIWYEITLAKFKLGDFVTIRQFVKFSSSPKFVVIWYIVWTIKLVIACQRMQWRRFRVNR